MHPKFLPRSLLFITSTTLVDRPRTDCTVGNKAIARTASGHDRPRDCNRLTSLTASSPKTGEDVLIVAGWLTRIPWWALLLAWSAINVWQAAQLELFHDEAYYWMFSASLIGDILITPDGGLVDYPRVVDRWRTWGPAREPDLLDPGRMAVCPTGPTSAGHGCGALVRAASLELVHGLPCHSRCPALFLYSGLPLCAGAVSPPENTWLSGAAMAVTAAGLLYSKYHGVLIIGTAVLANLQWVRTRRFWACALIGLLLLIPHLYWQWSHGWVSVTYHLFERVRDYQVDWLSVVEFIGIQLVLPGLLLGPWAWTQFAKTPATTPFERTLKAIVWVTVGFFFLSCVSDESGRKLGYCRLSCACGLSPATQRPSPDGKGAGHPHGNLLGVDDHVRVFLAQPIGVFPDSVSSRKLMDGRCGRSR